MRLVSLIASASEIIHALGLTAFQAGRSHECDYPPEILDLPVCTAPAIPVDGTSVEIDTLVRQSIDTGISVYQVFGDVLERLQPTHIVTQIHCRVCAVSLHDLEQSMSGGFSSRPQIISLNPNSLADIWEDIRRVAGACAAADAGEQAIAAMQRRMSDTSAQCGSPGARPRVACIEWLEPLMTSGNWMPELIEMAGGVNLFGEAGRHSPAMSWEDLAAADPDVLLISPCGFDLRRTESEMDCITARPEWSGLKAVREGRAYLIDGNQYMNRPGARLPESLQAIAETLHPNRFRPSLEGVAWKRFQP